MNKPKRINKLTKVQAAVLFEKYIPMTRALAKKYHRKSSLPLDELCREARSIWGYAVAEWPYRYQSSKSSPTSWAYRKINWGLLDYCTRKQCREIVFAKMTRPVIDDDRLDFGDAQPHKTSWLDRLLHTVGEDAKIVVETILHAPSDLVDDIMPDPERSSYLFKGDEPNPRAHTFMAIQDYMEDELNWTMSRFEQAWRELLNAFHAK